MTCSRHEIFVAVLLLATAVVQPGASSTATSEQAKEYELFRQKHGRAARSSSQHDEVAYETRLQLYLATKEAVAAHNAQPDTSWTAGLNQLADYTAEEFNGMLGHRPSLAHRLSTPIASFLEMTPDLSSIADSRDWRDEMTTRIGVKNQGGCGSCWAVAAVTALEFRAALNSPNSSFAPMSYEQLVDCVSNPHECGGQGGCEGATAELAYTYIQQFGLFFRDQYKRHHHGGTGGRCHPRKGQRHPVTLAGFTRLPTNELSPLLHAVATKGPVVVSADASGWQMYDSGVFNSCSKDATVNHAVVALGYGTDTESGLKYWLIRNSWGRSWGQEGHILLLRHDFGKSQPEDGYCGTDHDNQQGVGCKEDPKEVPVCGMCGMLSDSVYPHGVLIQQATADEALRVAPQALLQEERQQQQQPHVSVEVSSSRLTVLRRAS